MPKAEAMLELVPINFKELAKRYGNAKEYMFAAMFRGLRRSGQLLKPQIKDATPVGATGNLKRVTVWEAFGKAEDMRMEIRQSAFSNKGFPYGKAVRTGTKPHFPPVAALIPWVIKRLNVSADEARGVAFLVARKISRVGTKANPYHIKVFDQNIGKLKQIMKDEMAKFGVQMHDLPKGGGE